MEDRTLPPTVFWEQNDCIAPELADEKKARHQSKKQKSDNEVMLVAAPTVAQAMAAKVVPKQAPLALCFLFAEGTSSRGATVGIDG